MKPTRLFAVAVLTSLCTLHAEPPAEKPAPDAPVAEPALQITEAVPLQTALQGANAELRKPNADKLTITDLRGHLAGTYHIRIRSAKLEQQGDGDWSIAAVLPVHRALNYSDDSQAAIRSGNQAITSARHTAAEALKAFDKRWKKRSVKINGNRVNGWVQPGCQKRNPPITDEEHARRRESLISRGHSAIAAAESQLEATKARYKELRETTLRRARTVDVRLTLPADAPQLELLRAGRDARIQVAVADLTIAQDPPQILRPGRHISTLKLVPAPAASANTNPANDPLPQPVDNNADTQSES